MSQPFVGEIRMFAGTFAPAGWMFCDGQLLPISEYETLFILVGTTYGGDGEQTFALPDLRGRVPIHVGTYQGTTFQQGEFGGTESVTLTTNQLPTHTHSMNAYNAVANSPNPGGNLLGLSSQVNMFFGDPPSVNMKPAISSVGGNQPHDNMMPILCVSFIISLFGIFPHT